MRKLTLIVLLMLFCTSAFAHSGRTDSNGGHMNHSTGIYHYHHGYSAHQHEDGNCPYDFDNNTNSTANNTKTSNSTSHSSNIYTSKSSSEKGVLLPMTIKNIIIIFCIGLGVGLILLFIYYNKFEAQKNKMIQDFANREKAAMNQGKLLAETDLRNREIALQNREANLIQQIKDMKVEADKFKVEASQIISKLPPKENVIKVMIPSTSNVRSRYHRVGSACTKTGHKVYLQTAIDLGLQPCEKCKPEKQEILEIPGFKFE